MLTINKSQLLKALFVLTVAITLASCKKKGVDPAAESVTINGSSYPVVKIGSQLWTSVNYNGAGGVNHHEGSNDPAYGKLYTRAEALAITPPQGWRLPTRADLEKLAKSFSHSVINGYVSLKEDGVTDLMSTSGWVGGNGNNSSGFNAKAAGIVYIDAGNNNIYQYQGFETRFISSTSEPMNNGSTQQYKLWILYFRSEKFENENMIEKTGAVADIPNSDRYRYSVRFVKDAD